MSKNKYSNYLVYGTLLFILIFTAAIRVRLLDVPLERDEGAYAYAGQLILQGLPSSSNVYLERFPAIYCVYAVIMAIFGQTHIGIHLGLLVVNAATIILVFFLVKRLFDSTAAIVASASFAVLSFSQPVQGIFANAEHFALLAAMGGILLTLRAIDSRKLRSFFYSGVLLGLASVIKPQAIFFAGFAGVYILYESFKQRSIAWRATKARLASLCMGFLAILGLTCVFHVASGAFGDLWFWVFKYPNTVMPIIPIAAGAKNLLETLLKIIAISIMVWALAGIGISAMFWDEKARFRRFFVSTFLAFSFFSLCPGFYFRPHYFILLLPAIALLTGIGISSIGRLFTKFKSHALINAILILVTIMALSSSVFAQRVFLFKLSPKMLNRVSFGPNPFPESLEMARYIKEHSSKNDRIAILGSEPQICFYANRRSATGYIITSFLMEKNEFALKFQEEMIREIETAQPKFLVFVNVPFSWLKTPESEELISTWFNQYCRRNYKRVGLVDMLSPKTTRYYWDNDSIGRSPQGPMHLSIFKRK